MAGFGRDSCDCGHGGEGLFYLVPAGLAVPIGTGFPMPYCHIETPKPNAVMAAQSDLKSLSARGGTAPSPLTILGSPPWSDGSA
jgi:hypothetical protein